MHQFSGWTARLLCLVIASLSSVATAAGIPSAVIGPHEYDLPLNFAPIGEVELYGSVNSNQRAYASNGEQIKGPDGASNLLLPKFAYLAPLGRHLGYELEALVPVEQITGPHPKSLGVGDPIFASVLWFKPTDATTLGGDLLIQPAWGQSRYSSQNLVLTPTLFYDANWRGFNLDGDVGLSLPGDHNHEIGGIRNPADTAFANLRLAYRVAPGWEPFLSSDWQSTGHGRNDAGQRLADSNSRELALGAGVMWSPSPATSVMVNYSHTVSGANVVQTNALYFHYVYAWNL